jgi:hypothetical protein
MDNQMIYSYLRKNEWKNFNSFMQNNVPSKYHSSLDNSDLGLPWDDNYQFSKISDNVLKIIYDKENNNLFWCQVDENIDMFLQLNYFDLKDFKDEILSNLNKYILTRDILKIELCKSYNKIIKLIVWLKNNDKINIEFPTIKEASIFINNIYDNGYCEIGEINNNQFKEEYL